MAKEAEQVLDEALKRHEISRLRLQIDQALDRKDMDLFQKLTEQLKNTKDKADEQLSALSKRRNALSNSQSIRPLFDECDGNRLGRRPFISNTARR